MNRTRRLSKVLATILAGGMLLQTTSCTWQDVLYDLGVQTVSALVTGVTNTLADYTTSTTSE